MTVPTCCCCPRPAAHVKYVRGQALRYCPGHCPPPDGRFALAALAALRRGEAKRKARLREVRFLVPGETAGVPLSGRGRLAAFLEGGEAEGE